MIQHTTLESKSSRGENSLRSLRASLGRSRREQSLGRSEGRKFHLTVPIPASLPPPPATFAFENVENSEPISPWVGNRADPVCV